ncbi:MAG: hypothetical protein IJ228_04750 [Succinivibrio sp.]|nr:hypothetical protein [Succinivibrio sp.]
MSEEKHNFSAGEKAAMEFFELNDLFAAAASVLVFENKIVIDENELKPTPEPSYELLGDLRPEPQCYVAKTYSRGVVRLLMRGVAVSEEPLVNFFVNAFAYDGGVYWDQVINETPVLPVMSVVLYLGADPWSGPRSMLEGMKDENGPGQADKLWNLASDYKMKIIELAFLKDEQIALLPPDLQALLRGLQAKREGREYEVPTAQLKHAQQTLALLKALEI